MHRNLPELLNRLQGVKRTGEGKWIARCPAHDDRSPSLAVRNVDDRVLCHCFAGCSFDDVLAAVGMSAADLMPEKTGTSRKAWQGVPGYNASELLRSVVYEANLLALALADVMRGEVLSEENAQRVNEAINAVNAIGMEVKRGKAY